MAERSSQDSEPIDRDYRPAGGTNPASGPGIIWTVLVGAGLVFVIMLVIAVG